MAPSFEPTMILSPLPRADGSAVFSQNGYSVIGAVNGPLEISRREELPEEAVVDVIIRPSAGTGGTRERHIESILRSTLRQIILVHNFPRTVLQVTLQVISVPENHIVGWKLLEASSNLPILPALLQAATLALLSASIPLSVTLTSTYLSLTSREGSREIMRSPSISQTQAASSTHVLAFTSSGDLLLAESQGTFTLADWDEVYNVGRGICCGVLSDIPGDEKLDEGPRSIKTIVRSTLESKISDELHWKQ